MDAKYMYEPQWFVSDTTDCYFYHSMDVPTFGEQLGQWDLRGRFDDYIGNVNLSGKRVLDVGTASGFLAFSAEDAGASEVVAFDLDTAARQNLIPFQTSEYVTNRDAWIAKTTEGFNRWKKAFWLMHRLMDSKVLVCYGNIYEIPKEIGLFDVVIVGSVLEHLRDPFGGLESIAARTRGTIIINTSQTEENDPIARFLATPAVPQQNYTWWLWSKGMYRTALSILGFSDIKTTNARYKCLLSGKSEMRTTIVASRPRE